MMRVLLVDDQELVRTGLRGILRPEFGFDIVGECADGSEVSLPRGPKEQIADGIWDLITARMHDR